MVVRVPQELTCPRQGAVVAVWAPGFPHAATAQLLTQLSGDWVQTLSTRADQTETSTPLLAHLRSLSYRPAESGTEGKGEREGAGPSGGRERGRWRGEREEGKGGTRESGIKRQKGKEIGRQGMR